VKSRYRLAVSDTRASGTQYRRGPPLSDAAQARYRRSSARAGQAAGAVVPADTPETFRKSMRQAPDDEV
jgi:hypothetical protein